MEGRSNCCPAGLTWLCHNSVRSDTYGHFGVESVVIIIAGVRGGVAGIEDHTANPNQRWIRQVAEEGPTKVKVTMRGAGSGIGGKVADGR